MPSALEAKSGATLPDRQLEEHEGVAGKDLAVYTRLCGKRKFFTDRPFAKKALKLGVRSGNALDLGCGPGHISAYLARFAPKSKVWAMDISPEMLLHVRENANKAGVSDRVFTTEGDMRWLPFEDNSFDLVVSQYVFHHLPDLDVALSEVDRVLKPGGALLIRDFVRPSADLKTSFLMKMAKFVLRVDEEGRKQYKESLLAGFKVGEVQDLIANSPLTKTSVKKEFPSQFLITRKAPVERKTSPISHERAGRILAGLAVLATLTLGYFHHPLWFLPALGTCANLIFSGITDRCAVRDHLLIKLLGLPGERDIGREEAEIGRLFR